MKRLIIYFLFLLFPALCLAEEKVYTNTELKPEPPIYNKNAAPQQQQPPIILNNKGRVISRGVTEQNDPGFKQNETRPQLPQTPPNLRPQLNIANPSLPQQVTFEQMIIGFFAGLSLFMILVIFIPFVIWLICLIDILRNEFTGNNKVIWFLVVFFLPVLGSILYFFIGTDQKVKPEDDEETITRLI